MALDNLRTDAGRLDDVAGVVGTLSELVVVDTGWEAAFEAAAGEALAAVVVDGLDAARRALATPAGDGNALALLAVGLSPPPGPGGADASGAAVLGARVRDHVRPAPGGHPGLEALLDAVLHTAIAVDGGWEHALDTALAHPGAVIVTTAGDRFAPSGWRVGRGGPAATEAALAEARGNAERAASYAAVASERLRHARWALDDLARHHDDGAKALADHDRRLASLAGAVAVLEAERRDLVTTFDTVRTALEDQESRLAQAELRVQELQAALPELEAEEAAGAERAAAARRLRERADALASLGTELEVRRAGLDQRRQYLASRLAGVESRLERVGADRRAAIDRRAALDRTALAVERLAATVERRTADVDARLDDARLRRRRQAELLTATSSRLDGLRSRRGEAERRMEEVREGSRRAELEAAEAAMRLEAAVDAVRRELDVEPEAAEAAACPELPPGTSAESRARELERELRLLGPVNPLATDELAAQQERHAFLEAQLEDVRSSRRELGRVIRAVDAEIVQLLSAAYADVADNFGRLFETLFPGGQGRLRLTDLDNLLETGIEIEARPAGKNVRRLSLLSGGERSLCALAFLFAVFRSRPSPFYLLDEVEAALDDVNLHRFLDLLAEFRQEAQLLVVSHQKRTMEAADCLYGVTMQAGGTSRVLSERVGAVAG